MPIWADVLIAIGTGLGVALIVEAVHAASSLRQRRRAVEVIKERITRMQLEMQQVPPDGEPQFGYSQEQIQSVIFRAHLEDLMHVVSVYESLLPGVRAAWLRTHLAGTSRFLKMLPENSLATQEMIDRVYLAALRESGWADSRSEA